MLRGFEGTKALGGNDNTVAKMANPGLGGPEAPGMLSGDSVPESAIPSFKQKCPAREDAGANECGGQGEGEAR